jgi:predicted acylesterase/phospholipase RssA
MLPKWLRTERKKECNVILSAGGVKALAHIGALQALEEEGWKIKNVCGISAGAIVSTFYASGYDLDKLERTALKVPYNNYIKPNFPMFHRGLLRFNGLGDWVADACLKLPEDQRRCSLHIGACSITSGRHRVFTDPWSKELLSTVIEGTCAVPVLFTLVPYGDEMLTDGGLWSFAPVHYFSDKSSPAHNKLPTFVINVQSSRDISFTDYYHPIKLLYRTFEVLQMNRVRGLRKRIRGKKVCVVEPKIPNISSYDFKASPHILQELIEAGRRATELAIKEGKFDG